MKKTIALLLLFIACLHLPAQSDTVAKPLYYGLDIYGPIKQTRPNYRIQFPTDYGQGVGSVLELEDTLNGKLKWKQPSGTISSPVSIPLDFTGTVTGNKFGIDTLFLPTHTYSGTLKTDNDGVVYVDTVVVDGCEGIYECIDTNDIMATVSYVQGLVAGVGGGGGGSSDSSWALGGNIGIADYAKTFIGTLDTQVVRFVQNSFGAGILDYANMNTAFGPITMQYDAQYRQGKYNTAIGARALIGANGDYNVALGYNAGEHVVNGSYNIAIGLGALQDSLGGDGKHNIGIGEYADNVENDSVILLGINATSSVNRTLVISDHIDSLVLPLARRSAGDVLTYNASGFANWQPIPIGDSWSLNGNASAAGKKLGTTDNTGLSIITNDVERIQITATGQVGVGGSAFKNLTANGGFASLNNSSPYPSYILDGEFSGLGLDSGSTILGNPLDSNSQSIYLAQKAKFLKLRADTLQIKINTHSAGDVLTSDGAGNATWQPINDGGFWKRNGNSDIDANVDFVGTTNTADLVFKAENAEAMRVQVGGNIGIGTINPLYKLTIKDGALDALLHATGYDFGAGEGLSLYVSDTTNSTRKALTFAASKYYFDVSTGAKVGIGVSSPSATLDLNGTFKYTDGSEAPGKLLTSDSSGNATWQSPYYINRSYVIHQVAARHRDTLVVNAMNIIDSAGAATINRDTIVFPANPLDSDYVEVKSTAAWFAAGFGVAIVGNGKTVVNNTTVIQVIPVATIRRWIYCAATNTWY